MGESTTVVFTSKKMIRFILPFAFVIIQICSAAEWGDSGVKLNTKQMACYANKELYGIMTTASAAVSACADNPGKYPNGKTAGASFCMFDSMGFFNDDKMKIHWGHVRDSAGSFSHFVMNAKILITILMVDFGMVLEIGCGEKILIMALSIKPLVIFIIALLPKWSKRLKLNFKLNSMLPVPKNENDSNICFK